MKSVTTGLVAVCGGAMVLAGVLGFAQPEKPKTPATPTTPAAPKAPATPATPAKPATEHGQPTMEEMMAHMAELAKPGKMHEFLTSSAGTWEGKCTSWNPMDPTAKPTTSTCTTIITARMNGLYTTCETKGTLEMAPGQMVNFEGFGINTYNNASKKFESTWSDTMAPMIMTFTGDLSDGGKTLTLMSHYHCPMMDQDTWMRLVEKHTGSNTMTLEMYGPTMDGKGEFKMMQIDYTRKH